MTEKKEWVENVTPFHLGTQTSSAQGWNFGPCNQLNFQSVPWVVWEGARLWAPASAYVSLAGGRS